MFEWPSNNGYELNHITARSLKINVTVFNWFIFFNAVLISSQKLRTADLDPYFNLTLWSLLTHTQSPEANDTENKFDVSKSVIQHSQSLCLKTFFKVRKLNYYLFWTVKVPCSYSSYMHANCKNKKGWKNLVNINIDIGQLLAFSDWQVLFIRNVFKIFITHNYNYHC